MDATWPSVIAEIDRLVADESTTVHQDTIGNLQILLKFAVGRYPAPDEVGPGYWPTICLYWTHPSADVEIEVHQDLFEIMRFPDGPFQLWQIKSSQENALDLVQSRLDSVLLLPPPNQS